jgi:hypothetical protein
MALTPKETARLALMEKIIPIAKPYFDRAKDIVNGATDPGEPSGIPLLPTQLDLSSIILLLLVDDLKDEYQSLKARQ